MSSEAKAVKEAPENHSQSHNDNDGAETSTGEEDAERNEIGAWALIPHFQSRDIQRTIDYYTHVLHFSLGGTQSNSETGELEFASLAIGYPAYKANIYFFLFKSDREEGAKVEVGTGVDGGGGGGASSVSGFHPSKAMIGLSTLQVDEYYRRLIREGSARIVEDIADREWGYRQFAVEDHDGNVLQFFRFLEGGNPSD